MKKETEAKIKDLNNELSEEALDRVSAGYDPLKSVITAAKILPEIEKKKAHLKDK